MTIDAKKQKELLRLGHIIDTGFAGVSDEFDKLEEKVDANYTDLVDAISTATEIALETQKMSGDAGYTPIKGIDYEDGHDYVLTEIDKNEIASKIKVPIVEKVIEKTEVIHEQPIIKEREIIKETIKEPQIIKQDQSGEEIIQKINQDTSSLIKAEKIEGWKDLESNVRENLARVPKDFDVRIGVSKTEVKALTDRIAYLETHSTGGGGYTKETPTGAVDSSNVIFTVTAEPVYIISDGITYFDGAGYTYSALTITLDSPPNQFIRSFF
jgi:hypothetical protein